MNQPDERSLFTLSAPEAQERLDEIFADVGAGSVYQLPLARALMLAEAAGQKVTLEVLQHADRRASLPPTSVLKTVEQLIALYFDGKPAGIDLLVWDREGFIHGWSFAKGKTPSANAVAYPATVSELVSALRSLASALPDWDALLEKYAMTLDGLLEASKARALAVATQRVDRRPWAQRLFRTRAIVREMAGLGFLQAAL